MKTTMSFPDGKDRCHWVTDDQTYIDYHDHEWGTETRGQVPLFEAICLEGFQAGLSWLTILKRREGFRSAFDGFIPEIVSNYGLEDVERLVQDERIIRNRAKVQSAIKNAQLIQEQRIDLTELLWSFAPKSEVAQSNESDWLASSAESDAMSKELKRLGFSFVGSTTMYALMQSTGMIFDHAPNCFRSN